MENKKNEAEKRIEKEEMERIGKEESVRRMEEDEDGGSGSV